MLILADFNVIKPDFGLLFWTSLFFILFWVLVGKFAFKPIAKALLGAEVGDSVTVRKPGGAEKLEIVAVR